MFLSNMEKSYPFIYLQSISIMRPMNWYLTKAQDGVLLGGLSFHGAFPTSTRRNVSGLLPRSWKKEFPLDETPLTSNTFLLQFVNTKGDFPCQDFRPLGQVHSSPKSWCALITGYFIAIFEDYIMETRLYRAIRAVQFGILTFHFHFFCLLELYSRDIGTFFLLLVANYGQHFTKCTKCLDYQQKRSHMKNMYPREKNCIS